MHDRRPVAVRAINLIVVRSRDVDASRAFYEAIGLNLQPYPCSHFQCWSTRVPAIEGMVTDPDHEVVPTHFELHPARQNEPTGSLILGFFVESVDRAVEQAVAAGGSVLSPAATWPYGRRAAVSDPDGNRIELSEDPFGRPTGGMPI
jgi:predicted enzyme related to lactoylglutathione lyase